MSRRITFFGALAAAILATITPAPAGAETIDKLANLTFTGPVQVPGATLAAGTYRFRLANPESSRNIVQVLSHDGSSVYAMFYTMPDVRTEVTDDAVVTFKETPAGVPPVVRSLFYGDEHTGYEFLYTGKKPIMTAAVTPQPPITYTRIATPAPEPISEPAPAPVPKAAEPLAFTPTVPALTETTEATQAAEELPKTGGLLPLLAFGGMASLVLGLGVGLVRRRLV